MEARELLEKVASDSRFAGSESEARARKLLASLLEANGFAVSEELFTFSEFPARWGVPIVALILAAFALGTIHVNYNHGGALPALGFFALGLVVVLSLSRWLARTGTMRMRWMRSRSANLVATRGAPSVWLVAHLDSKSQTIPMLVRIASILAAAALTVLLASVLVALSWPGARHGGFVVSVVGEALALALLPLVLCFTADHSRGAVDNASGVISVILAAQALRLRPNLGVIITSGEELGLVGARAFIEAHGDRTIALNCDTIDDLGGFRCMVRGARGTAAAAVGRAGSRLVLDVPIKPMIPGILADSIALSHAGWDSVTLSRGNLATLARVHTTSDTRERLNGTGIAKAARLLAATVEELS
jgi:hypothetical protein